VTITWTVDTTPPDTTIVGRPNALTNSTTATFSFTAEAGATFRCVLDGAAPAACVSPQSYAGLAAGAHAFSVTATDAAGNVDATPATAAWSIDTATPDTIITSEPMGRTRDTTAAFSFTSSKAPATFRCKLDAAPAAACDSGSVSYAGLSEGQHTFVVVAIDQAGAEDIDPATYTWTIDLSAPAAPTIAVTPAGPANDNQPTAGGTAEPGSRVTVRRGGCAGAVVAEVDAAEGTYAATATVADDSTTVFSAIATDAAGNVSPCASAAAYIEDSTAPALTVVVAPVGPANDNNPSVSGTTEAGATVSLYLGGGCTGAAAATAVASGNGAYSFARSVADNTTSTFRVQSVDAAGNASTCRSVTYVEDSAPPVVTFTATPKVHVTGHTIGFNYTVTDAGPVTVSCSLFNLDVPCSATSAAITSLAPGRHSFTVSATDAAGNSGSASLEFESASPSPGHVVLIGHDFAEASATASTILANAIGRLIDPAVTAERVLVYSGTATPAELANLSDALPAAIAGRQVSYQFVADMDALAYEIGSAHVVIFADQNRPAYPAYDSQIRAIADAGRAFLPGFVSYGGVVIVTDGLTPGGAVSGTHQILGLMGLMATPPSGVVSYGGTVTVADGADPLMTGVPASYAAPANTIDFPPGSGANRGAQVAWPDQGSSIVSHLAGLGVESFQQSELGPVWPWGPWTSVNASQIAFIDCEPLDALIPGCSLEEYYEGGISDHFYRGDVAFGRNPGETLRATFTFVPDPQATTRDYVFELGFGATATGGYSGYVTAHTDASGTTAEVGIYSYATWGGQPTRVYYAYAPPSVVGGPVTMEIYRDYTGAAVTIYDAQGGYLSSAGTVLDWTSYGIAVALGGFGAKVFADDIIWKP
jgi:hypothetical protein